MIKCSYCSQLAKWECTCSTERMCSNHTNTHLSINSKHGLTQIEQISQVRLGCAVLDCSSLPTEFCVCEGGINLCRPHYRMHINKFHNEIKCNEDKGNNKKIFTTRVETAEKVDLICNEEIKGRFISQTDRNFSINQEFAEYIKEINTMNEKNKGTINCLATVKPRLLLLVLAIFGYLHYASIVTTYQIEQNLQELKSFTIESTRDLQDIKNSSTVNSEQIEKNLEDFKYSSTKNITQIKQNFQEFKNFSTENSRQIEQNFHEFKTSQESINGYNMLPLGTILFPFLKPTTPNGWLDCNGQSLNKSDYIEFWNEVKEWWQILYGATMDTFTVPDLLRERFSDAW